MARRTRRPDSIDLAAAALASVAPSMLSPSIDQLRLDLGSIARDLRGARSSPYSTPASPPSVPPALGDVDVLASVLPESVFLRVSAARRDMRMLVRELRGRRAPFVVPRAESPAPKPRRVSLAPSVSSRALRVVELVRETERALSVRLEDPLGPLSFVPGQFLTLLVNVDGRAERRSYSISSVPADEAVNASDRPGVTITIQRIEGGRVSSYLHDALRVGEVLEAIGPSGFFAAPKSTAPRHLVFFAGGSGITPIASIAESALRAEPGSRVTLVHGSADAADVIFRQRFDSFALAHGQRTQIVRLLERGDLSADPCARRGRPDGSTTEALVDELRLTDRLSGEDPTEFFLCGPHPMMDAVRSVLLGRGVARARVHEERFGSPGGAPAAESPSSSSELVTVRRDGVERSVTVPPGRTILEAATREGLALRSSCAMGGCGACKCRLTSGHVVMEEPNCLTAEERADGFVLTCVGRPRGPVTLETT